MTHHATIQYHLCDCVRPATHKTGEGWECDRCKRLNRLAEEMHTTKLNLPRDTDEELRAVRTANYHRLYNRIWRRNKNLTKTTNERT